jgi:DUF971 family protein
MVADPSRLVAAKRTYDDLTSFDAEIALTAETSSILGSPYHCGMKSETRSDPPSSSAYVPSKIEQRNARTLAILWSDGVESLFDVRALRLACGCANCVDEWSGEALLAAEGVPIDVAPIGIESVGRYAIQINWSDGHNTGIYPFERLRKLADSGRLGDATTT